MENKEFSKLLEKRTRDFGIRIIRLSANLPDTTEGRGIKRQITKSGTSIGANYREANRARSKQISKIKLGFVRGASETQYWLEVVDELGWLSKEEVKFELKECGELLAIFTAINKK